MTRRTLVLLVAIVTLVTGALVSVGPAGASRSRDVDPAAIDPHVLALPPSALPAGATVTASQVSDNNDANASRTHNVLHQHFYTDFHRLTGYRMDYTYTVQGVTVEAGYLASIFPTSADARAALEDATGPHSIIAFVGTPLPDACPAGEICRAFSGTNPDDGTKTGLIADFVRGPILVEAAAQVPNAAFAQLKKTMEDQVFGVAGAVDAQVKQALGTSTSPTGSPTAVETATLTPAPTDTATPKPAPAKKKCKKNQVRKHSKCVCKKGYKLNHGKCKKVTKK